MPVYGYIQNGNPKGLVEMLEVHFWIPTSRLRHVAAFLNHCADQAEAREWQEGHTHLNDWTNGEWDDCEVIVIYDPPPEGPFPPENEISG
jgi:hypothetical protein